MYWRVECRLIAWRSPPKVSRLNGTSGISAISDISESLLVGQGVERTGRAGHAAGDGVVERRAVLQGLDHAGHGTGGRRGRVQGSGIAGRVGHDSTASIFLATDAAVSPPENQFQQT